MANPTSLRFSIFILMLISQPLALVSAPTQDSTASEQHLTQNRGYFKDGRLWPSGVVKYAFSDGIGENTKNTVLEAMREIEKSVNSVVKFKKVEKMGPGVVRIMEDYHGHHSCIATVGYYKSSGMFLAVQFGTNRGDCGSDPKLYGVGIAVHELMHTLGFIHEYQRNDRDNYIKFNYEALVKYYTAHGFQVNRQQAEKLVEKVNDDTKGLPFNFKSITNQDFAEYIIVKKGVNPKPIGTIKDLGQICYISAGDRNLIELTYYKLSRGKSAEPQKYNSDYKLPGFGKEGCRESNPTPDEMNSEKL